MLKYSKSGKDGNRKDFTSPHNNRQSNEDSQPKDSRTVSTTEQCHKVAPQKLQIKASRDKASKISERQQKESPWASDGPKEKEHQSLRGKCKGWF